MGKLSSSVEGRSIESTNNHQEIGFDLPQAKVVGVVGGEKEETNETNEKNQTSNAPNGSEVPEVQGAADKCSAVCSGFIY